MDTTTRPTVLLAISAALVAAFTPAPARADVQPQDTPAATRQKIQQAIDSAGADGTVTLGNGTFEIDAELMVTNGVKLVGQGWTNTIVKQTANGQRVATLKDASHIEGVTATGGRLSEKWTHGAGLLVEDGTVSWCCITNNLATGRNVHGGGVSITKGTVDHSIVAFNQAGTHTSVGGGIGIPSGYDTVLIDACLIYGNIVSVEDGGDAQGCGGGGFGNTTGNPNVTIRNTTITDNSSGKRGGGVRFSGNKVNLVNCIVSGNAAEADADVSGTPASGSEGNLVGVDPALLFVDTVGHDYHLDEESLALRAGVAYGGIGKDLDGADFASSPSVGCYEFTGELRVVRPVFSPASGVTFYPSLDVSLSCRTAGATIRYTTDGTDPTENSDAYAEPIHLVAGATTIKVCAFKDGLAPSRIVEATYTRGSPTPPVVGEVTVTPMATMARIFGEIESIGNNAATGCDVFLAIGTRAGRLDARTLIASGATASFDYVIPDLASETTYYYEITIVNDAQIPQTASVRGAFATIPGLQPVAGDPTATRSRIQEQIDAAASMRPAGTVALGGGVFEIDAQLMVTNGVTLVGRGWNLTTIEQTASPGANTRVATLDGGATIRGVTLTGGRVTGANNTHGGAVLVKNGTISWCRITNNSIGTANSKYGAGVAFYQGKGQIDHTIIAHNSVSSGSGTCGGGGVSVFEPSGEILIDTCLIYGNTQANGQGGAGLYADFRNFNFILEVRNTTIATNEASAAGGGVYVTQYDNGKVNFSMKNTILADNVSRGEDADPNLALPSSYVSRYAEKSFGNLFANGTPALGTGSKSAPGAGTSWFVKPEKGNFHLPSGSPAARVGKWYEGIAEDLDGTRRLKWPAAGCYEAQSCTILILR